MKKKRYVQKMVISKKIYIFFLTFMKYSQRFMRIENNCGYFTVGQILKMSPFLIQTLKD